MSLIEPKKPDNFTSESPIRAFTDFQVAGRYAIGKGFRPSLAHLSRYLNAMENKEGWALAQIILPDNDAGDPTIVFRKTFRTLIVNPSVEVTSKNMGRDWRDSAELQTRDETPADDLGAPHRQLLIILVNSNFGQEHSTNGIYSDGRWMLVTHMDGDTITHMDPLRGVPLAWRHLNGEWNYAAGSRDKPIARGTVSFVPYDPPKDDPINPQHYGGTACAEIGELLTANSYQVLKYNWRLGKKDEAIQEIDKSLWYLDREMALTGSTVGGSLSLPRRSLPSSEWFDQRLEGRDDHTRTVAWALILWNRTGEIERLRALRRRIQGKRVALSHGQGLAV